MNFKERVRSASLEGVLKSILDEYIVSKDKDYREEFEDLLDQWDYREHPVMEAIGLGIRNFNVKPRLYSKLFSLSREISAKLSGTSANDIGANLNQRELFPLVAYIPKQPDPIPLSTDINPVQLDLIPKPKESSVLNLIGIRKSSQAYKILKFISERPRSYIQLVDAAPSIGCTISRLSSALSFLRSNLPEIGWELIKEGSGDAANYSVREVSDISKPTADQGLGDGPVAQPRCDSRDD